MQSLNKEYLESKGFYQQDEDFILRHSETLFTVRPYAGQWWFHGYNWKREFDVKCKIATAEEFDSLYNFMVDSHAKLSYNNSEKGW